MLISGEQGNFWASPEQKARFDSGTLTPAECDDIFGRNFFLAFEYAVNFENANRKFELPLPVEAHPVSSSEKIEARLSNFILETASSIMQTLSSAGALAFNVLDACKAHLYLAEDTLDRLGFDIDDLSPIRGKKFLVLGSGSKKSGDNLLGSAEPWFCRYIYFSGGQVIGIDIAEQSGEPFRSYAIDLTGKSSLSFLPSGFFDFVVCTKLVDFDSPSSSQTSNVLKERCDGKALGEMATRLMDESCRVLANGGKMVATADRQSRVLEKRGNQLVMLQK